MAVSATEFWQQLVRLGVFDPGTGRAWMDRFQTLVDQRAKQTASAGRESRPIDPTNPLTIAQFLIAKGVLTEFQAQRVIAGRAGELRAGDFLITDRLTESPLRRWFRAKQLTTGNVCLAYPCTDLLTSARWVDPAWLQAHAAVEADHLQPIQINTLDATDPWRGLVVSVLPTGRTLDRWLSDQTTVSYAAVAALGQQIADAMASLHVNGLVHADCRPSRIWCGDDQSFWLLRDAGRPPAHPLEAPLEHQWFDADREPGLPLAPEISDLSTPPTPRSDLFGLGATLYDLAVGWDGPSSASGSLPQPLQQAKDAGASGDPLLRTLAYALDPQPEARFADLAAFSRALAAVTNAYQQIPAPVRKLARPSPQAERTTRTAESKTVARESKPVPLEEQTAPAASSTLTPSTKVRDATIVAMTESESSPSTAAQRPRGPVNREPNRPDRPVRPERPPTGSPPAVATESDPVATAVPATKPIQVIADQDTDTGRSDRVSHRAGGLLDEGQSRESLPTLRTEQSIAPEPPATVSQPVSGEATPSSTKKLRKRKRRSRRGPIIVGSVAALVLFGLVAVLLRPAADDRQAARPPLPVPPITQIKPVTSATPATTQPSLATNEAATETKSAGFELVGDDRLLWAPPWPADSQAAGLEMIPPGSQMIISVRLQRLLQSGAGQSLLAWIGPELQAALQAFEAQAGVSAKDVERLTIALSAGNQGTPKAAYAVTLAGPMQVAELAKVWKASPSRTRDGKTIYSDDQPLGNVYYVSEHPDRQRSFAFGPVELMTLVAENDGDPIPLPRALQQLWDTTSQEADVAALGLPNFLFADGRSLLQSYAPQATEPLRRLLIPDVSGAVLSMSFGETWYFETRLSPSGTVTAPAQLRTWQNWWESLPEAAETFAVQANVDPSWKAMAIRLPQFVRVLVDQSRFGISQTLPTMNSYLPGQAAPQLLLAGALALSQPAGSAPVAAPPAMPVANLTIQQMLETPLSISFDQESLQFAVEMIREEFQRSLPEGVSSPMITILGGELEKMGITQNQQIRNFAMRDRPLREALTELARQANPDKSVTELTDPKQSLLWVIDPAAPADKPAIQITTRQAATASKIAIPKEFGGSE